MSKGTETSRKGLCLSRAHWEVKKRGQIRKKTREILTLGSRQLRRVAGGVLEELGTSVYTVERM